MNENNNNVIEIWSVQINRKKKCYWTPKPSCINPMGRIGSEVQKQVNISIFLNLVQKYNII